MKYGRIFYFCLMTLLPLVTHAEIWTARNNWSLAWEEKFAEWIEKRVEPDFLRRAGISTDCADAYLTLRWVFSRENALPAANSLNDGAIFSHLSDGSWSTLPTAKTWTEDQRFLKALEYLNHHTSTYTLKRDAYPIEISRRAIRAGSFFINRTEATGHIDIVARINNVPGDIPIRFFSSTEPEKIRDFLVYPLMKSRFPKDGTNGFMRLKWALVSSRGVQLASPEQMPFFSREQFSPEFAKRTPFFDDAVTLNLTGQILDPMQKLGILSQQLMQKFAERVSIVEEGLKECKIKNCREGSGTYDSYSTPSRDLSILFLALGLEQMVYTPGIHRLGSDGAARLQKTWMDLQDFEVVEVQGKILKLGPLISVWKNQAYSSDPNAPVAERWALDSPLLRP